MCGSQLEADWQAVGQRQTSAGAQILAQRPGRVETGVMECWRVGMLGRRVFTTTNCLRSVVDDCLSWRLFVVPWISLQIRSLLSFATSSFNKRPTRYRAM